MEGLKGFSFRCTLVLVKRSSSKTTAVQSGNVIQQIRDSRSQCCVACLLLSESIGDSAGDLRRLPPLLFLWQNAQTHSWILCPKHTTSQPFTTDSNPAV